MDLETGAVVQADLVAGNTSDSRSIKQSLDAAKETLDRLDDDDDDPPGAPHRPAKKRRRKSKKRKKNRGKRRVVADKGYFRTALLVQLERDGWRTYFAEPKHRGRRRWKVFGEEAKRATYRNRRRIRGVAGRALQRLRGERVERVFAHVCETGAHRRLRLADATTLGSATSSRSPARTPGCS